LELRQLIRRLAAENLPWGEERIANELLLKLGLRVSPHPVITLTGALLCTRKRFLAGCTTSIHWCRWHLFRFLRSTPDGARGPGLAA
jgi:hypothetical protein